MNDSLTNFREASIEDIPQIIEIMNRGYHQNWDSNYYKNLISDGNSFAYVLSLNEEIVGFITGKKSRDICDIYMIIVDIKYRRQGFANLLLSKTITALSDLKITEFFLEVAETNNQAINLYQKNGFIAVNRRIGYYKISNENIDAIVYRLVNK
ncbi:MAG: GNAT family N-acetyltransferase [Hyphomicrobiales bacterium]|jgi:ribosomal-protein-alanine N-acetyltransferase